MSVTTTENPIYYNTAEILRDYQVYHSNTDPSDGVDTSLNAHPNPASQNPENWPTDHRGIPAYRPINYNMDLEARGGWGRNGVERTFIFLMMNGVRFNGVSSGSHFGVLLLIPA